MRLLRAHALDVLPRGGYEAETTHLRRVLRAGHAVAWVPIPAIYGSERSSFRPAQDSARVLWALVRPLEPRGQLRTRQPFRGLLPPARPARSARRDTRATRQRRQRLREAAV
jgi:hypothetical protein